MDRVSAANYQTIGGKRTFRDKDPAHGVPLGTNVVAAWLAGVQESIVGAIEAVGITPADAALGSADTQLLRAIKRLAAANKGVVSSSTTLAPDDAGLILADATAGNVTITLPAASAANGIPLQYEIVRVDTSSHAVTVALSGSDALITWGTVPLSIGARYSQSLMSDGVSKWVQMNPPTDRSTLLCLSSAQSIPNNVETAVSWPAAVSDTALAATSSGITIPSGVSRVKFNFSAAFAANGTGSRKARLVKNTIFEGVGLGAGNQTAPSGSDVAIVSGPGGVVSVVAGDTFQLLALQTSGGALNLSPASNTWLSMEVVA